tara:strand:+ start:2128 stop:2406 length:279 start_codon:yes stop_codon:yes gene_type:complete
MTKLIGEEKRLEEIVKEILDVFSETSLEYESNRRIVAETIAKDLVNVERNHEQKQKKSKFSRERGRLESGRYIYFSEALLQDQEGKESGKES